MNVAAEGVVLHDGLEIFLLHFFGGHEEELGFDLWFALDRGRATLQKGQLKMLPSTSLRQHFQQTSVWLQGGNIQI
jgi:hypothetical protein